jgi:hypothetical protein
MDSRVIREDPAAVAVAATAQRVVAQQAAKDLVVAALSQETPQGKRPEVEARPEEPGAKWTHEVTASSQDGVEGICRRAAGAGALSASVFGLHAGCLQHFANTGE